MDIEKLENILRRLSIRISKGNGLENPHYFHVYEILLKELMFLGNMRFDWTICCWTNCWCFAWTWEDLAGPEMSLNIYIQNNQEES